MSKLTPSQELIANHQDGHSKVLAGAGSGKSATLISRVERLLAAGVLPSQILIVMFGSDPAKDFSDRLKDRLRIKNIPSVVTFHKLGSQFLIKILSDAGLVPKLPLETKEYKLKKACVKVMEKYLQKSSQQYAAALAFMSFIDLVKSTTDRPVEVFKAYRFSSEYSFFPEAFQTFERRRKEDKMRYFSDLIYDPMKFLLQNKEHIKLISNHFKHILLDEYQDINDIQELMIKMIAGDTASVMAVGDDDQCIYSWRGAKPHYMISGFDVDFPNPTVYYLPETFRYGHQISMAAYSLISNNIHRNAKCAVSSRHAQKTQITLDLEMPDQNSVAQHIMKYMASGNDTSLADIVVLVRAYSHAVPIEIGLLQAGISYRIEGGSPIFDADDIGSIITCLHLINNSYERLNDIQKADCGRKFVSSPALNLSFEELNKLKTEITKEPDGTPTFLDGMQFEVREDYVKRRLQSRANAWRTLSLERMNNPAEAIRYAMEIMGVLHDIEYTSKTPEEAQTKRERFEAIIKYAEHTGFDLNEFMAHIMDLMSKSQSNSQKSDSVCITSIHRSKGLEWPVVIMSGLAEGKFPCYRSDDEITLELIEDERRLFYVAMTRAQQQLILIAPNDPQLLTRLQAGCDKPPPVLMSGDACASRFLYEANPMLCQQAETLVGGNHVLLNQVSSPEKAVKYIVQVESVAQLYQE